MLARLSPKFVRLATPARHFELQSLACRLLLLAGGIPFSAQLVRFPPGLLDLPGGRLGPLLPGCQPMLEFLPLPLRILAPRANLGQLTSKAVPFAAQALYFIPGLRDRCRHGLLGLFASNR